MLLSASLQPIQTEAVAEHIIFATAMPPPGLPGSIAPPLLLNTTEFIGFAVPSELCLAPFPRLQSVVPHALLPAAQVADSGAICSGGHRSAGVQGRHRGAAGVTRPTASLAGACACVRCFCLCRHFVTHVYLLFKALGRVGAHQDSWCPVAAGCRSAAKAVAGTVAFASRRGLRPSPSFGPTTCVL